jgi:hypothetical protein
MVFPFPAANNANGMPSTPSPETQAPTPVSQADIRIRPLLKSNAVTRVGNVQNDFLEHAVGKASPRPGQTHIGQQQCPISRN